MKKILVTGILVLVSGISVWCSDMFPKISGWKMQEDQKIYNSGDLWALIDGAAEIFLGYNFEDLHIAEYSMKDQIIRVEIYRQKTPVDAYGIYSSERMPDYQLVEIGSQGYKSQGVLNFLTASYYVKVMSIGTTPANESSIAAIAEGVDNQLAQQKSLPVELGLFPKEGMIYLSDNYIAQNFLGYSFFRSAFSARYDKPAVFQLFIIHLTTEEIQKMLQSYFQILKEDKIKQKGDLYVVQDLFNGVLYLEQKDGYLIGVWNTENEKVASEYIANVISNLP
jgi:hypothetical protein